VYDLEYYSKIRGSFDEFLDRRSSLIFEFENGKINKRQFLEYNYDLVMRMNIRPFLRIDNFQMGMYNYQYYNVLAKYFTMLAKEVKETRKRQRYYNYYLNKGNNYYQEKDKAALDLLNYLNFQGVEAYYINLNSRRLDDSLYEIVLLNYKEAIFHSKSKWLLDILKDRGVFIKKKRTSLIDEYINNKY